MRAELERLAGIASSGLRSVALGVGSVVVRLGRKSMVVLSSMPAQRNQSSKYGAWKSEPNEGGRPLP